MTILTQEQTKRICDRVLSLTKADECIVNIEGSGSSARAHINFGRAGMKMLDLSIAKLERVGR